MTKTKKKPAPVLNEEAALMLANEALQMPMSALTLITRKEEQVFLALQFSGGEWHCSLTFKHAWYGAWGRGEMGEAVKMAILRAYGVGSEKDWQLRDKSFQGGE